MLRKKFNDIVVLEACQDIVDTLEDTSIANTDNNTDIVWTLNDDLNTKFYVNILKLTFFHWFQSYLNVFYFISDN